VLNHEEFASWQLTFLGILQHLNRDMYGYPWKTAPETPFYQGSDPLINAADALNRKERFQKMIAFFKVYGKHDAYWADNGGQPNWNELEEVKQSLVDFLKKSLAAGH